MLRPQEANDLPDRRQVQSLRIDARRLLGFVLPPKAREDLRLEQPQIITRDRLGGRDGHEVAAPHLEHPPRTAT